MLPRWRAPRVLDAGGAIVHPGFIDAHLHINAHTCRGFFQGDSSRGGGTGPNYADWKAALRPEDEQAAAALGCLELLRHGYTAFVEPGSAFEPDAIAAAAEATGVRCSLADPYLWDDPSLMDVIAGLKSPSLFARVPPTRERSLELLGGQLHRNRDPDGIVHGHVALYGEGTASDELLQAAKALADREGVVLNSHLGFDLDMAAAMEARWGRPRFAHLADAGRARAERDVRPHERDPRRGRRADPRLRPVDRLVPARVPPEGHAAPPADAHPGDAPPGRVRRPRHRLGAPEHGRRRPVPGGPPGGRGRPADRLGGRHRDGDARRRARRRASTGSSAASSRASAPTSSCVSATPWSSARASIPRTSSSPLGHGPTADTVLVNGRVVLRGGRSTPRQRSRGDRRGARARPPGWPSGSASPPRAAGRGASRVGARPGRLEDPDFSGGLSRPRGRGGGRVPAWRPSARRRGRPAPR